MPLSITGSSPISISGWAVSPSLHASIVARRDLDRFIHLYNFDFPVEDHKALVLLLFSITTSTPIDLDLQIKLADSICALLRYDMLMEGTAM
jgi:hypothetical protein